MKSEREIRTFSKTLRKDERGAVAVMLTVMLPVFAGFMTLAVDMAYVFTVQDRLQIAADAAALSGAQYAGLYSGASSTPCTGSSASPDATSKPYCYYTETVAAANPPKASPGGFLQGADIVLGTWSVSTSGGTFTPVSAGTYANAVQATVRMTSANGNALGLFFTPMLSAIAQGAGFSSFSLTATATAAFLQWPQQITMNLTGAKGWWYKTVTLYALPYAHGSAASSYTQLAQWVYQPQHFGSATGSANVTIGNNPANGTTGLQLANLGSGYGTLTGPSSVDLGQYADVFMAENVMQGPCPPSKPWTASNFSSGSYSFPTNCYATQSAAQLGLGLPSSCQHSSNCVLQEPVGNNVCSESELSGSSNPAYSSYNSICNPYTGQNASKNSSNAQSWQFIFVNFYPTQSAQNTNVFSNSVSVSRLFPCGQTVAHEWEDGGSIVGTSYSTALASATDSSTTPQQDFFYSVYTTCGSQPGIAQYGYYAASPAPQLVQ
jgi:Flp pilus assembly protein TadG